VTWYADPAHPTEIGLLRQAGFVVKRGNNDNQAGIAVVRMLLETGRLKVVAHRCPSLMAEAQLYRYPTAGDGRSPSEVPIDEHNHALGALRYLCSRLYPHLLSAVRKGQPAAEAERTEDELHETREAVVRNPYVRPTHALPEWLRPDRDGEWFPLN
jgi:hypothetical protein